MGSRGKPPDGHRRAFCVEYPDPNPEAAVTPGTALLVTFAAVAASLFVALWLLGSFVQSYAYSEPAGRMPLRAAAGGLILGGFITFWVYVNTRAETKDRYGSLFMATAETRKDFTEFDAVRRYRPAGDAKEGAEKAVPFKRPGGRSTPFVEVADGKPFTLTTADYLTVALEVKEGDAKARFDAELDDKGKYKPNRRFVDRNRRYIEFGQTNTPSEIVAVSRGAFLGAVALNLLCFVAWFVVLWPVMRFTLGHALGLSLVLGGATMLLLMPLLFEKNPYRHEAPRAEQKAS
jgi:hypothetical protein